MTTFHYIISKKALSDLEEIWFYTMEKWSLVQADRYYKLMLEEFNYICKKPHSGKNMDHLMNRYRASKVKSHIIFYKIDNETIQIIRILHESMDIENRLTD